MPVPAGSTPLVPDPGGPLYYDPVLSRVRIEVDASMPFALDAFARTVSGSWGTATSGQVWSGSGSAYSTNGSAGRHHAAALSTLYRNRLTGLDLSDVDARADAWLLATAPLGNYVRGEITVWDVDSANYHALRVHAYPDGFVAVQLVAVVAGVETVLRDNAAVPRHSAGISMHLRVQTRGDTIRAKVWRDDQSEPSVWQVEAQDTHPTGSTALHTLLPPGNSNTLPYQVVWDNVTVTPSARVERSIDNVTWTAVRGAAELAPGEITVYDYEFTPDVLNYYRIRPGFAGSITPVIDGVWLKNPVRPALNRKVTPADMGDVTRPGRGGAFRVAGRPDPIAVTEVRGGPTFPLILRVDGQAELQAILAALAPGDVMLVQAPAAGRLAVVPTSYVTVGDTRERLLGDVDLALRALELPCTQVTAPGPEVTG